MQNVTRELIKKVFDVENGVTRLAYIVSNNRIYSVNGHKRYTLLYEYNHSHICMTDELGKIGQPIYTREKGVLKYTSFDDSIYYEIEDNLVNKVENGKKTLKFIIYTEFNNDLVEELRTSEVAYKKEEKDTLKWLDRMFRIVLLLSSIVSWVTLVSHLINFQSFEYSFLALACILIPYRLKKILESGLLVYLSSICVSSFVFLIPVVLLSFMLNSVYFNIEGIVIAPILIALLEYLPWVLINKVIN